MQIDKLEAYIEQENAQKHDDNSHFSTPRSNCRILK